MYYNETNAQNVGRAAHVIIDTIMGLLQPQDERDPAQNDAASTLNQTVGDTVEMEARKNKEVREWQQREARQRALELATGVRTPHDTADSIVATADSIVATAKAFAEYLAVAPPRANLGLATNEELIRELDARYSMGHRAPGYKSTGRDTIS